MQDRPVPDRSMPVDVFRATYFLKEDLADFLRANGLNASGSKQELTERIARFLETGEEEAPVRPARRRAAQPPAVLTPETVIEENITCSQAHRAFFREHIGRSFSFNTAFQNWLKANTGKTYADAVAAYADILAERKRTKPDIGSQFEYNTYIRDFFAANPGRTLAEAILCWKLCRSHPAPHRYAPEDLKALEK